MKLKFNRRQELVFGAFRPTAAEFESVWSATTMSAATCASPVGARGLTPHMRARMMARIARDQMRTCPFVNLSSSRTGHWAEDKLVS